MLITMQTILAFALAGVAVAFLRGCGKLRREKGILITIIAGVITLKTAYAIVYIMPGHYFLGLLVGSFGLITLMMSAFAGTDCSISRSIGIALGTGAILIGVLLLLRTNAPI